MGEWPSYRLEDFLLFSPRVYWRLFESHNEAVWPAHLAAIVGAAVVLTLVFRGRVGALTGTMLLLAAGWLNALFLLRAYVQINWAAAPAIYLFALQSALLAGAGLVGPRWTITPRPMGAALCLFGAIAYPVITGAGAPWRAQMAGIMPDPTAIATLGCLMMIQGRGAWLLAIIPLLWCLMSAVTLYGLDSRLFLAPTIAAIVFVLGALAKEPRCAS